MANRMMQLALSLAAIVLLLDQASKWIILGLFAQPPLFVEVTGFFNLVLAYNYGVSFGILNTESAWKPWALSALALVIVGILLFWLRREQQRWFSIGVGLVIGGALGNVIDRLRLGAVVDFLDFHLGTWHWPAFNVADSAVVTGVVILLLDGLFRRRPEGKN